MIYFLLIIGLNGSHFKEYPEIDVMKKFSIISLLVGKQLKYLSRDHMYMLGSVRINLPLFSTVVPAIIIAGTTVENKGKLILTEIFPSVQKHIF